MRIGFFDSGIGGLTVLKEALKVLPNEAYIYYADTVNAPYGTKPRETVKKHIFNAVEFLSALKVEMLVIACNTATSVAAKELRDNYNFPIIGMEPAVKPAIEKNNGHKRILVVATELTLKEEKFQNLVSRVDNKHIVDCHPLSKLVTYAENFEFNKYIIKPYLKQEFSAFNFEEYSTLVLGCTHFPLFHSCFRELLPEHIDIIDGNLGTVRHMKNIITEKKLLTNSKLKGSVEYYISGTKVTDTVSINKYETILQDSGNY